MPLQDVTNDQSMLDWLRQSGHGHLIDDRSAANQSNSNPLTSSQPPAPLPSQPSNLLSQMFASGAPPQQPPPPSSGPPSQPSNLLSQMFSSGAPPQQPPPPSSGPPSQPSNLLSQMFSSGAPPQQPPPSSGPPSQPSNLLSQMFSSGAPPQQPPPPSSGPPSQPAPQSSSLLSKLFSSGPSSQQPPPQASGPASQQLFSSVNSSYPPASNEVPTSTGLPSFFGGANRSTAAPVGSNNDSNQRNSPTLFQSGFPPLSSQPGASTILHPNISVNQSSGIMPTSDYQTDTLDLLGSQTHFHPINPDDPQLDTSIENLRLDPNTKVVQRASGEDVVYKQRVFVRYLQPPTPPPGGTIIVREKQEPGPAPDPPIVIKRAPPEPRTPPPMIIRERPPPMPPTEGTTVIDKVIPAGPKPPPQVIIEQYPQLPPKPQDIIIQRWLPMPPRQRKILYERLPVDQKQPTPRTIIVQYGLPNIRVQREVSTESGAQLPFPQRSLSSLTNYNPNPHSSLNPFSHSAYGLPLSELTAQNQIPGLGSYGSGTSSIPITATRTAQPSIFNVPESVPLENVLRQLGVDTLSLQRSSGPIPPITNQTSTNNWNPINHQPDFNRTYPPNQDNNRQPHWNPPSSPVKQNSLPNFPHQPPFQNNYPSQSSQPNYPPPPSQPNYPPPPSQPNYPPRPSQPNYPPPSSQPNYPPSSSQPSYPPPPSQPNYPPPQTQNNFSGPPSGGPPSAGNNVLARLFGGG